MHSSLRAIDLYEEKAVTGIVTAFLLWNKLTQIEMRCCEEHFYEL